ncbi:hypothetical protein [Methylobacterium sp. WL116]|uniref:hypothetical protein n=1 Tax=Methylobacterium sp. WL116 TaxID=2603889 RepID=UPI0011C95CCB|nr:hypothetical protein [Methylobacterium sp. WL116]TXM92616.1 hypothetical protein FV223_11235 [Methylobacterium sp. WL116]
MNSHDSNNKYDLIWEVVSKSSERGLTVSTFRAKGRTYNAVSSKDSFYNHAWEAFDLEQVCGILTHEETSFKGHKYVLTAALSSWALDPGKWRSPSNLVHQADVAKSTTRRQAIVLAATEIVSNLERRLVRNALNGKSTRDSYAAITTMSPTFFNEIYYPIGGLRRIMRTQTRVNLLKRLQKFRQSIYLSITLAAIEHCHFQGVDRGSKLEKTGVEKSTTLVGIILAASRGEETVTPNNVDNSHYKFIRKSLPFLYAAYSIDLPDGRNLLDVIMEADWKIANEDDVASLWFGRTLYWVKFMLAPHRRVADDELIIRALSSVDPIPFEPPPYVANYRSLIEYFHERGNMAQFNNKEDEFWAANNMVRPKLNGKKALGW